MGSFQAILKKNFLTGLIVLIPVIITVFVIVWFFEVIDGILGPVYDRFLGYHMAGIGFISAVLIIYIVGMVSTNVFGKRVIGMLERLFLKLPVFKSIYTSVKQVMDAFSPSNAKNSFKWFVIVEHPRQGTYAFGFLTKECSVGKESEEKSLKAVYIPTNNLYLGDIVLLKDDDIFYTNIPVEEGIKIILSAGIAAPERIKGGRP
ncbi:MAG: DUF502 domain-containing protein [Thermodesulfovibrionales bacterium]|nr:DUF502 domain-containing protein [Thermodesulfovibrionales bacterium]